MTTIRLHADDQTLIVEEGPRVASGDKKSVCLHLSFSEHWRDYTKSAVFYTSWDKTVYEELLTDNKCFVPHEVLAKSGNLFIGIRGVDSGNQADKTSNLVKYKIEKGAPVGDATSKEPTPDVYHQILEKLDDIQSGEVDEDKVRAIVVEYLANNPIDTGSPATIGVVDLIAANWVASEISENLHSQVVTIYEVPENFDFEDCQVDLTPSVEQLLVFYEKDLTFTSVNEGGIVTVYAIGQQPEHDYTIQVTITEVNT